MGTQTVETEETALDETGIQQFEASFAGAHLSFGFRYDEARAGLNAMVDRRPALIAGGGRLAPSEFHHEIGVLAHARAPSACQVGSNDFEEAAMSWQSDINEARSHRCLEESR